MYILQVARFTIPTYVYLTTDKKMFKHSQVMK